MDVPYTSTPSQFRYVKFIARRRILLQNENWDSFPREAKCSMAMINRRNVIKNSKNKFAGQTAAALSNTKFS